MIKDDLVDYYYLMSDYVKLEQKIKEYKYKALINNDDKLVDLLEEIMLILLDSENFIKEQHNTINLQESELDDLQYEKNILEEEHEKDKKRYYDAFHEFRTKVGGFI